MRDRDYTDASLFLAQFFGPTTTGNVEVRALPNQRGGGRAAPLFTRDPLDIEIHLRRWDEPLRAVFFGMATRLLGHGSGRREDLAELAGFWSDIDCGKLGLEKPAVAAALRQLFLPPSAIIDSGHGIHGYWLFREALDIRVETEGAANLEADVLAALKQLAGVVSGDLAVCDLARVMRLPGTHNTKLDQMVPCGVLEASWARYEYRELLDWLDWQRPILEAPRAVKKHAAHGNGKLAESDAFARYAATAGIRPPVDAGARLAAMEYLGAGDAGIHQTQLHCSASMVTHGATDDEIAGLLMAATHEAVGLAGEHWNWKREEMNIRQMIRTARAKFDASPRTGENPIKSASPAESENPAQCASPNPGENPVPCASPPLGANPFSSASPVASENPDPRASPAERENPSRRASAAQVIHLAQQRSARPRGRPRKDNPGPGTKAKESLTAKTGDAVIAWWQETRGRMAVIEGSPYTYRTGIWAPWTAGDQHALKYGIQGILAAGNIDPKTQLLNAVARYVLERPDLAVEGVRWNATGSIVLLDVTLMPDPAGGWVIVEHSPDHWATSQVEIRAADMEQGCPQWLAFLDGCFSDRADEEPAAVIACLQEWMGAAMVHGKPRELRKALWLHGESRTGKTRILEVLRLLIGEPTCALKLERLGDKFGPGALLDKRGWIADDAVGSDDDIDDAAFKVVVTGEAFTTDRKNLSHATSRLDIPVAFSSNVLPKVRDQSDGVFNRSILIDMHVVWSEEQTAGKSLIEDAVRAVELAGVFAWALAGWDRLMARGMFQPPASMREAAGAFKDANNPALAWARVGLVTDPIYMIDRRDLYASFKAWFIAEYGEDSEVPSQRSLTTALHQTMPVGQHVRDGYRLMTGVKMTDIGARLRDDCPIVRGKIGSGRSSHDINQIVPVRKNRE